MDQDLRNAYATATTAYRQAVFIRDQLLPAAQEQYEIAFKTYTLGGSSALEVIDAQRTLLDARDQYATALGALNDAIADLERAVGAPLDTMPPDTAPRMTSNSAPRAPVAIASLAASPPARAASGKTAADAAPRDSTARPEDRHDRAQRAAARAREGDRRQSGDVPADRHDHRHRRLRREHLDAGARADLGPGGPHPRGRRHAR